MVAELFIGSNPPGPFGNHADFVAFYTAAHLVLHGGTGYLYDGGRFASTQLGIIHHYETGGYMPFLNPPYAAVLLAPLGLLAEPAARIVWFALNLGLAVILCRYLAGTLRPKNVRQRWLLTLLLLGTFPLYESLIEGQLSLLMLAVGCLALTLARRQRPFWCGACLSILWLKPQLAILAILALAVFRAWRVISGMSAAIIITILLTLPVTGLAIYGSYAHYLISILQDHLDGAGAVYQTVWSGQLGPMAGINGLFATLFGQSSITLVDGFTALFDLILLALYARIIRRKTYHTSKDDRNVIIAITLGTILLLDPHLYQWDVVFTYLLLPLLADRLAKPVRTVVLFTLAMNLLVLDHFLPLHLFTVALFAFTVWLSLSFAWLTDAKRRPRDQANRQSAVEGALIST